MANLQSLDYATKLALLKRLAARFRGQPQTYVAKYLKRQLTAQQSHIAELLHTPPRRVLVRSANNQGKTFLAACMASYWFDTYAPSVTLATAPTRSQVRDLLFKELRTLRPHPYGFLPKDTRLQDAPDHYIHGLATQSGDAFQGRHAENLLLLFDEATGIDRVFWERGETMFSGTPGHGWLCTYNPNDVASPAFQAEESGLWHLVVLNGLEHPNIAAELAGLPPPIPSAIRLARVEERIAAECEQVAADATDDTCFEFPPTSGHYWRPTTPEFEVQVLGRWPGAAMSTVWSAELWAKCSKQQPIDVSWPVQIGCDVARFGDDKTTFAVRKGRCLVHLEARSALTTTQIADRLRELCHRFENREPKQVACLIDDTGGYGAGVIDQHDGYSFRGVNSASKAMAEHMFPNVRSELWFNTLIVANAGGVDLSRATTPELKADLLSTKYALDKKNRRRVESKQQTKARLKRSPDLADAINLAWYVPREDKI